MLKLILVSHFILSIATYCIILEKASSLLISALFYFFQIYRERLSSMNSRVIYNCYTWWIWSAKFIQIKNFLSLLFMNEFYPDQLRAFDCEHHEQILDN